MTSYLKMDFENLLDKIYEMIENNEDISFALSEEARKELLAELEKDKKL